MYPIFYIDHTVTNIQPRCNIPSLFVFISLYRKKLTELNFAPKTNANSRGHTASDSPLSPP